MNKPVIIAYSLLRILSSRNSQVKSFKVCGKRKSQRKWKQDILSSNLLGKARSVFQGSSFSSTRANANYKAASLGSRLLISASYLYLFITCINILPVAYFHSNYLIVHFIIFRRCFFPIESFQHIPFLLLALQQQFMNQYQYKTQAQVSRHLR